MKIKFITIAILTMLLLTSLSAEIIKQQSFEEEVTDTWGYSLSPAAYYDGDQYSIWDRDDDILARLEPLPDEDGEYLFVMENTAYTNTELHKFIFDTVDLSSYTGDLSAHFYYYTFYYGSTTGAWSGVPDSIGYYVEYNNGTDWDTYIPLDMGTNDWTQINIDIPDTANYFRLCIVGKNSRWEEIGAFDYVYLLEDIDEPTNHVSSLIASSTTDNSMTVTWTDNDGAQAAENFLVKISQGSTPTTPVDGTEEHPSATVKQIAPGVETATFTGLDGSTSYTVSVYPYTNLDVFIDYKTDGTVPVVTASTQDTPTPICLASFEANATSEGVELTWETATETENSGFNVYRNDEMIAFINGAGTTTEPHNYSYVDKNVIPGVTYTYVLADVDFGNKETKYEDDAVTVTLNNDIVEADFVIGAAYPNPFNPSTTLDYTLTETNNVKVDIYNMKGEKITSLFSGEQTAGSYSLNWNAENTHSGIYVLRISIGNHLETQKLLLIK
jgi:hypothetical protein